MRWYRKAQAIDSYEAMVAEVAPWVQKGLLSPIAAEGDLWLVNAVDENGGRPFELWIDDDPNGGYALALGYRGPGRQIEDIYFDYDVMALMDIVREWGGTLESQTTPVPTRSVEQVQEELYDAYKNKDDARTRPLLEEYEKMTGKKRPGFMASRTSPVKT